ncbi:MAG: NFACT family protein [Candidatus Methylomirabilales bacterium]
MDAVLLLAVIADLRRHLVGAEVSAVLPAGPDGLWLGLRLRDGEEEGLLVTADPALPRLCRGAARPPAGARLPPLAAVARRVLAGTRLDTIEHAGLDRALALRFRGAGDERFALAAELFGPRPALLLLDAAQRVAEGVRRGAGREGLDPGQPYAPPPSPARPDPVALEADAIAALLAPRLGAGEPPASALAHAVRGLTPLWAAEVLARAAGPSAAEVARALTQLLGHVVSHAPDPHVLLDAGGRAELALPLRLAHRPAGAQEAAPSLAAALERVARTRGRAEHLAERRRRLLRVLKRVAARLESRRAKLIRDGEEFARAGQHQRMGEILVQHQAAVPRGAAEATLPDPAGDPGATVRVPLDPRLSALANAERLFRAARRGRRGAMRVAGRMAETERELAEIRELTARLPAAGGRAELDAIQEALVATRLLAAHDREALAGASPARGAVPGPRAPEPSTPAGLAPRQFVSSDGLPILVGRNPESNDYLTQRLARGNDLWLHVQNRPGSHVVVRLGSRPGGPPRRTLVEAAKLAAYYSQARDEGKVAVDYTLRKYVRKPRKAKPGLVTISQEKTLIVTPDKALVSTLSAKPRTSNLEPGTGT